MNAISRLPGRQNSSAIVRGCRCACSLALIVSVHAFSAQSDTAQTAPPRPAVSAPSDTAAKYSASQTKDTSRVVRDSFSKTAVPPLTDSLAKKSAAQTKPLPTQDTVSRFLKTPYFSFGIGWELGTYDVYNPWQNQLPDSVGNILRLNPDTLGFTIIEPVNGYNIMFPLSISYTPFVYSRSTVSFEASFCFISKSLQVMMQHDTGTGKINYRQAMSSYTFNLGVLYRHAINEKYFRIEGVDRTSVLLGAYVLPYSYLSNETSISSYGIADSVVSAAKAGLRSYYAWGYGAGWRVGLTTQKALSQYSGMEISVSYIGRYFGYFREKQRPMTVGDITPLATDAGNRLSFYSNMVEIKMEFILGTHETTAVKQSH